MVEYLLVPEVSSDRDARAISMALRALPGVHLVTVSLNDRRVRVEHNGRVNAEELICAINDAGYQQVALLA
ncbi:MAG TPA: heavy metal-associated domain-containing protein [Roseiflexaceae bacterium]|nr:heavy metal-associated domain-containing protein [Roseiflexaceae bacterium]